MKKTILWTPLLTLATLVSSPLSGKVEAVLPTLYTVSGIVFAIGMGLIVSFSLHGIQNRDYIESIRENIYRVRRSFIMFFSCSTLCYLLHQYIPTLPIQLFDLKLILHPNLFTCFLIILSIAYFIVNFIEIQNLNDDIFDRLLKEKNDHT